ncbi:DUF5954 family protein [Streptomyces sp. NPDC001530]|uniref:DUF5954 family protein n=1 Tax=Streptomyces sp. NPDC001530 TaxID=3364582 RepID=UPI003699B764
MADDWKRQLDRLHAGLVRRDDPAAWVAEADAVDASLRYPHFALRGPVFGLAAQDPEVGEEWRLVQPMTNGMPQLVRDGLNSLLWFRAKDDTDDPAVRREVLAAVAVLEREPVDELSVLGVRYRVVRGDEFARSGPDGLEPPRPTDPEPAEVSWEGRPATPEPDVGFVFSPGEDEGLMAGALKMAMREFAYTGARFPAEVRADSERAVTSHPDVVLLPVGFGVVEQSTGGWEPCGALAPTPHDARRLLYDGLNEMWPLLYRFGEAKRARYARAAEEFRVAGRAHEIRVDDRLFRICRIERTARFGPDGPEPPRPSDLDDYGPMKMHPTMDEDGTLHYEE